ncbi:MAG: hypothetical protein IPL61_12585 [Myxococcales bacterium]|nr:hypothetical protein [Myxococcales bacterium]
MNLLALPLETGADGAALPPDTVDAPDALAAPAVAVRPAAPPTAIDTWQTLIAAHLAARPGLVSAAGELFPASTIGDVRRAALQFSKELCQPRYDLANLAATRAAWRDALARIRAQCGAVPWGAVYPDNEQFWLGDARALAQRLATVDVRRNRLVGAGPDGLARAVGTGDPLTTYLDLRAYFAARRLMRADDRGWRYPETTIADVVQIAHIVQDELRRFIATAPAGSTAREVLGDHVAQWQRVAAMIPDHARGMPRDQVYPGNAELWRAYRRVSVPLSVARDVARDEARRPFVPQVGP